MGADSEATRKYLRFAPAGPLEPCFFLWARKLNKKEEIK